jgi:thymidylate synthase ThyX
MTDFAKKKKITSALRRLLPNGQSNEIGFSVNLRSLRHLVMVRTSRHAEWEIREVFSQIYNITKKKYPLLYYGAKEEVVDGIAEVTGLKMQPYEQTVSG